jgi:hypothetical protein
MNKLVSQHAQQIRLAVGGAELELDVSSLDVAIRGP